MSTLRIICINIFVIALFPSFSCAAGGSIDLYPDLMVHGESYPNACKPDEKEKLYRSTLQSVSTSAEVAWQAIHTILCSPNTNANRFYLLQLMTKNVKKNLRSTGGEDAVHKIARSNKIVEEAMAQGQAWDVSLRTEPKKIYLQYFESEACVSEVVFFLADRKWIISEVGKACD